MGKIKLNQEAQAPVEAPVANPAPIAEAKPKAAKKVDSGTVLQIVTFLKSKGKDGASANEIGKNLGWVKDGMSKEDLKTTEKKVRTFARVAVDTNNGKRDVRNGRNKVYQIL